MADGKSKRRTVHGQQRHREGTRPTIFAFQDRDNPEEVYEQDEGVDMNLLSKREIASVQLFTVEISESELDTYRELFYFALNKLDAQEFERLFGDTPDEMEGMLDDIENIMEEAGLLPEEEQEPSEFEAEVEK